MFETRIESMCAAHMKAIRSAFTELRPRKLPYTFFADASLLRERPLRIIAPDLYRWHFDTSRINEQYLRRKHVRIIKRLVPVARVVHTAEEIEFIKYSLHFQMALGTEVWVVFTKDQNFLDHNVHSENISVVKDHSVAVSRTLYDGDAESLVTTARRPTFVSDLFEAFHSLPERHHVFRLWYDSNSFSKRRASDVKGRFGDFLLALQSHRCAISGRRLLSGMWQVDHIWPLDAGGNNTLINLQVVGTNENAEAGPRIKAPRFSPTPDQLRRYGFEYDYYRALSDRGRYVPRLGWNALHHLNLFGV